MTWNPCLRPQSNVRSLESPEKSRRRIPNTLLCAVSPFWCDCCACLFLVDLVSLTPHESTQSPSCKYFKKKSNCTTTSQKERELAFTTQLRYPNAPLRSQQRTPSKMRQEEELASLSSGSFPRLLQQQQRSQSTSSFLIFVIFVITSVVVRLGDLPAAELLLSRVRVGDAMHLVSV